MICSRCGQATEGGKPYCSNCGEKIENAQSNNEPEKQVQSDILISQDKVLSCPAPNNEQEILSIETSTTSNELHKKHDPRQAFIIKTIVGLIGVCLLLIGTFTPTYLIDYGQNIYTQEITSTYCLFNDNWGKIVFLMTIVSAILIITKLYKWLLIPSVISTIIIIYEFVAEVNPPNSMSTNSPVLLGWTLLLIGIGIITYIALERGALLKIATSKVTPIKKQDLRKARNIETDHSLEQPPSPAKKRHVALIGAIVVAVVLAASICGYYILRPASAPTSIDGTGPVPQPVYDPNAPTEMNPSGTSAQATPDQVQAAPVQPSPAPAQPAPNPTQPTDQSTAENVTYCQTMSTLLTSGAQAVSNLQDLLGAPDSADENWKTQAENDISNIQNIRDQILQSNPPPQFRGSFPDITETFDLLVEAGQYTSNGINDGNYTWFIGAQRLLGQASEEMARANALLAQEVNN